MSFLNPYKWNRVHLDLFYGRDLLVEDLISGMLNGQSFALMGGRRMGKTTVLRKIESEIHSRFTSLINGGLLVIPVYVDTLSFMDLSNPEVISHEILDSVARYVSCESSIDIEHRLSNPFAQNLVELLEHIPKHRVQIIILFDEISPIVTADWGATYLGNWRALLHNSPPLSNYISAVFAGAHEVVTLADDVSSPLANILSWKYLSAFSAIDTQLLVDEPSPIDLPNDFHDYVFKITGGHPFLIQYLMFHVVQSDSSDLYRTLDETRMYFLENEFRQFQNWFSDFDKVTQTLYDIIISHEEIKRRDLVRAFKGSGKQTQIQSYLNVLSSYGVIRHAANQTYRYSGEMFRSWYLENHAIDTKRLPTAISNPTVDQAFEKYWYGRLADLGEYNILVEGTTDKLYLETAAERYQEANEVDLLEGGKIHIVAGRGTKRMGPEFGMLQSLESQGIKYVVILDGDQDGEKAAEAMHGFGAQKNRHYFCLVRSDYRDKSGQSWDVEIEDMLSLSLIKEFILQHPDAVEERLQRSDLVKYTIRGRPLKKNGQTYDYKMMLAEYVRQHAKLEDVTWLIDILKKARKCMGFKEK